METTKNPQKIQTLNELCSALSEGERTTYGELLKSMELNRHEFDTYCSWSAESYTRNCIFDTEAFELILICWGVGQETPIHDHGGEECWVCFVEGDFSELIYEKDKDGELVTSKTSELHSGDISYMIDFMGYHKLVNKSKSRSMSLHLYSKPIRKCRIYDESCNAFVMQELSYDTVH
jgi:cysteine dioxygenase